MSSPQFQPGANLYTQGFGSRPENAEVAHIDVRAPTVNDVNYPISKRWVFINTAEYVLVGLTSFNGQTTASWFLIGSGSTGSINSITGDSGGAEIPLLGNFNLLGTANQITVTGTANTETFSIPTAFIAPGSILATTTVESTTTMTAGTGFTATLGDIVASAGNISATLGSVSSGTTMTAGTTLTSTGTFITLGGQVVNVRNVDFAASPYTVLDTDFFLAVDSSTGAITINFPNTPTVGRYLKVFDVGGNSNIDNITITTPGGVTTFLANGISQTSLVINSPYLYDDFWATSATNYAGQN